MGHLFVTVLIYRFNLVLYEERVNLVSDPCV